MKKYLIITLAVLFAANVQTFLFAKESSKKEGSDIAFGQFLNENKLNAKDFKNLLSDTSFISLEKLLLSPTQRAYNDLTETLPQTNKAQAFKENIDKVNKKAADDASYGQVLPDAYYKIYLDTVANPSSSPDFNLIEPDLTNAIETYEDKIIDLLRENYAFKFENKTNPRLTLFQFFNKAVNDNIKLLIQYYKANPGIALYTNEEKPTPINIKAHKAWQSAALHQEMLIKIAALRVIESNLKYSKGGFSYDLALFDIISLSRKNRLETTVSFNNDILMFIFPQDTYKYIPFETLKLVRRDAKFITALQEIEKKKQNPNYNFATKKDSYIPIRGQDYVPAKPSVYESPYGSGSVR